MLDRSRDALGRDSGVMVKDGSTVETSSTYAFGAADGRFTGVSAPAGTFTYGYLPGSSLIATVTGPAHTVTNQWEAKRDVLAWKRNKLPSANDDVSKFIYTVNGIGQRASVRTSGTAFDTPSGNVPADWDWGYDALGQVVSGDSPVNTLDRAYQYDQIGNRTRTAKGTLALPADPNYGSNNLNQYTKAEDVTLPVSPPPAPYDPDGNLRFDGGVNNSLGTTDPQAREYLWDAEWRLTAGADMDHPEGGPQGCRAVGRPGSQNRLTGAKVADGATLVTYSHDAFGRRVSRTTGTSTTLFLYDGWNVVAEYASTSTSFEARTLHTWGLDLSGGLQGAGGVGGLLAVGRIPESGQPANAVWHFPTYDGNGNISEYLDSAGATVAHYEYDPFGNEITPDSKKGGLHEAFAYRFSTKPLDSITGWYYYGFRYLIPVTGRWAGRDPLGERAGVNLSAFCANATSNSADALGLVMLAPASVASLDKPNGLLYSCYCGWLDKAHIDVGRKNMERLADARKGAKIAGKATASLNTLDPPFKDQPNMEVQLNGNPEELAKSDVLTTMTHVRAYENSTAWYKNIGRLIGGPVPVSGFSVEDMPSYYLGALIGTGKVSFEDVVRICDPLDEKESKWMFYSSKRPMRNTSHKPILWTDDDGVVSKQVETNPMFQAATGICPFIDHRFPCKEADLNPVKKAEAQRLFETIGIP